MNIIQKFFNIFKKEKLVVGFYIVMPEGLARKYNMTEDEFVRTSKIGGIHIGKVVDISNNKIKMCPQNKNFKRINKIGMIMIMYDNDTGLTQFRFKKPINESIIKNIIEKDLIYEKD